MQMIQVSQMHYTKQSHIAKDAHSSPIPTNTVTEVFETSGKWYAAIHVTFWNCWQSHKAKSFTLCGYSSY